MPATLNHDTDLRVRISLCDGWLDCYLVAGGDLARLSEGLSPDYRHDDDRDRYWKMRHRWAAIARAYSVAELLGVDVQLRSDGGTCETPVPVPDKVLAA